MARFGESGDLFTCSFCGHGQREVKELVAGPGVYICDECIDICCAVMDDVGVPPSRMRVTGIDLASLLPIWLDEIDPADKTKIRQTQDLLQAGLSRLRELQPDVSDRPPPHEDA